MRPHIPSLLSVLFWLGCTPDIVPATVIEHLQIVSMVAEPPEVDVHEATSVTVTIADPDGLSPEVAVWVCVPFGTQGSCLESELTGESQPVFTGLRDPTTHAFTTSVVPLGVDVEEINDVLDSGEPFNGILAFALACAPGACDLFEQLESGTVDPADLSDPGRLLSGVPMSQAHAAWRTLAVNRPSTMPHENPGLSPQFASPLETTAGSSLDLRLVADSSSSGGTAYPMTTVGGFALDAIPISNGPSGAVLPWVAQDRDAGRDGHIYVVVDDGLGGQAVWHGEASVR